MTRSKYSKALKVLVGYGLLLSVTSPAMATSTPSTNISYYSEAFEQSADDTKQVILYGDVKLSIKNKISITADKAAVNFADSDHHKIKKFVIYGNGTYTEKGKIIHFENGTFDPNTLKLSAEKIVTSG